MKRSIITALICCFISMALAAKAEFGEMAVICRVSFTAKTQAGEMPCSVAVCALESEVGSGSSLYVVTAYAREYSPRVERIMEVAHSPVIEKANDRISILFTSGANTTCVAEFSISKGILEFLSQEAIAWNEQGTYRKSASFARYVHLLERREAADKRLLAAWKIVQADGLGDVYYLYPDGLFVRQGVGRREFVAIGRWRIEEKKRLVLFDLELRNTTLTAEALAAIKAKQEAFEFHLESAEKMRWVSSGDTKELKRIRDLPDRTENLYWGLGTHAK